MEDLEIRPETELRMAFSYEKAQSCQPLGLVSHISCEGGTHLSGVGTQR